MGDEQAIEDVLAERKRQTSLGHVHDHDDGLDILRVVPLPSAASVRSFCERDETWSLVLLEEVLEALESRTAEELRAELVQVAAVAVRWIGALDARGEGGGALLCAQNDDEYPLKAVERTVREFAQSRRDFVRVADALGLVSTDDTGRVVAIASVEDIVAHARHAAKALSREQSEPEEER